MTEETKENIHGVFLIVKGILLLVVLYLCAVRLCQLHTMRKLDKCHYDFFPALEDKDFAKADRILKCEDIYLAEESFDIRVPLRTWNEKCSY